MSEEVDKTGHLSRYHEVASMFDVELVEVSLSYDEAVCKQLPNARDTYVGISALAPAMDYERSGCLVLRSPSL